MVKIIYFILPTLGAGGAERVMSFVAQNLDKSKFETKLIVLGYERDSVYQIDNVDIIYLNKKRVLFSIPSLFTLLYNERPTFAIGSISHINTLLALFALFMKDIKFVGRESTILSQRIISFNVKNVLYQKAITFFYQRLHRIVCQSEDMKEDFVKIFRIDLSKLILINNPITRLKEISREKLDVKMMKFVTVGRLSSEKGHLRVLEVLSKINRYNFRYTIVGTGPLLSKLREKIFHLGLEERVTFIPYTGEILEVLSKNDFFLQGSFVEGFPNSLLESCTVGTPVIAFNVPGGTKDIVINGVNGFLVDSESEFEAVLNNTYQLKSMDSEVVKLSVINRFKSENIIKQYEELFEKHKNK